MTPAAGSLLLIVKSDRSGTSGIRQRGPGAACLPLLRTGGGQAAPATRLNTPPGG
jgi:hypothetical protein